MSDLPMMPWWPSDYIAGTRAMRIAERGAYCELLFFQWEMGHLPTDHGRLSRLLGLTLEEFEDLWPAIQCKFVARNGGLVNERLESERKKALEKRDRHRRGAEKTNAKRRQGDMLSDTPSDTLSDAPSGSPPSPSPSPIEPTTVDSPKSTKRPRGWPSNWSDQKEVMLEGFKSRYPKRSGAQPWKRAREAINARLKEGAEWSEILEGAERYAIHVRAIGKEHSPFVMQAATFCGPECHYLEDWGVPQTDEEREQEQREAKAFLELSEMLGINREDFGTDESWVNAVNNANQRRLNQLGG